MSEIKRPGGEISSRPLHFIWIVDSSGSMQGEKIQSLNYAIRQTIPEMRQSANENPNASLLIRAIKFSQGANWHISTPTPVNNFEWNDITAGGETHMGKAFELLIEQLNMPPMSDRALPPVLVLLSDGQPTDEYKESLNKLLAMPWGKKAIRIGIAIGHDCDNEVLKSFINNVEIPVLQANNPQALIKYIKWASTIARQVSAPVSNVKGIDSNIANTVPQVSTDDDIW